MLIARLNGINAIQVADYREIFPDTSFSAQGPTLEFLKSNSCLPVTVWKPYNRLTEKLVQSSPYVEGDTVFTVSVEQLTQEEIEANTQTQWNSIRFLRDELLRDNVDTMNPMRWETLTEEERQVWREYRQTLLDITTQETPYNIVWPTVPEEQLTQ